MKAKEFIPASKPRNFVAKNQKTAGAGAHKDMKRAEKQGDVKHKKDRIPMEAFDFPTSAAAVKQRDTMTRPVSTSTEKVKTFTVDGYTVKFKPDVVEIYYGPDLVYSKDGNYANPTKLQLSGARRIVTHLAQKKKQDTAEGWSDAYVSRRTGRPRTPYSVYINGKKWKDFENDDHARAVMDKIKAKFKADGRDPETITIAPTDIPEGVAEGDSALEKFRKAASEREKKHDTAEKEMKARHASGKEDMKGAIDRLEKHLKGDVKESFTDIPFDQCPSCGGNIVHESQLSEKQDACYHKVRSRYKVWPSAYASGALVQCRKKGAKNWGNKSKK